MLELFGEDMRGSKTVKDFGKRAPPYMFDTVLRFLNWIYPNKHSSWWRRTEDVLKTHSRRLQCNIFLSCKTYGKYVLKASSRRLQEVLEDEKCYTEDVFKTSWRRLRKQEMFAGIWHYIWLWERWFVLMVFISNTPTTKLKYTRFL